MEFRQHIPGDPALAQVLQLLQGCFAYMDARIDPPSSLSRLTLADVEQHCRQHEVWSVGVPPHACVFFQASADALYLGRLAVASAQRNNGLAAAMVDLADARARDMGLGQIELKVRVELQENQRLFERMGFVLHRHGRHEGYAKTTYFLMRKKVG